MIALIEKTNFDTFLVKIYRDTELVDTWECSSLNLNLGNMIKIYDAGDSVLNITKVKEGYKFHLIHDDKVVEAILCRKVYVHLGVEL